LLLKDRYIRQNLPGEEATSMWHLYIAALFSLQRISF
jgi:hypothetical protein